MTEIDVESAWGKGVRIPIRFPAGTRRRRTLDERLAVRFPWMARAAAAFMLRLPPGSRLRRAMLSRAIRHGYQASNRGDFDVVLSLYAPVFEWRAVNTGGFIAPDLVGAQKGHEGFRRVWKEFQEAWEETRLEPQQLFDLGDRVLTVVNYTARGRQSGITMSGRAHELVVFRNGLVTRQEIKFEEGTTMESAGGGTRVQR